MKQIIPVIVLASVTSLFALAQTTEKRANDSKHTISKENDSSHKGITETPEVVASEIKSLIIKAPTRKAALFLPVWFS